MSISQVSSININDFCFLSLLLKRVKIHIHSFFGFKNNAIVHPQKQWLTDCENDLEIAACLKPKIWLRMQVKLLNGVTSVLRMLPWFPAGLEV